MGNHGSFRIFGWIFLLLLVCALSGGACDCGDDDDDDDAAEPEPVACNTTASHETGAYDAPFRLSLSTDCDATLFYRRDYADGSGDAEFIEAENPATAILIDRDTMLRFYSVSTEDVAEPERELAFALPPRFGGIAWAHPGDERVTLQWQAAWDADEPIVYRVYQPVSDEPTGTLRPIAQTAATEITFTSAVHDMPNGQSQCFVVHAVDADGAEDRNSVGRCLAPQPVLHASAAAAPGGDGTREAPLNSLQAAIELASDRTMTTIHVAGGLYEENVDSTVNDPPATESIHAVQVFGGFDPLTWRRNVAEQPTIVDGGGADVWRLGEWDFVDGFHVVGGGDGFVLADLMSVTIFDCAVYANDGVGIRIAAADVMAEPSITTTVIAGNGAGVLVEAMADQDSRTGTNPLLRHLILADNAAGGLVARASGDGPWNVTAGARLRNFVATANGIGIDAAVQGDRAFAAIEISNGFVGENEIDLVCEGCRAGALSLGFSDVLQPGAWGNNTLLDVDPSFLDPPDDFHLDENSLLIDAGSPEPLFADPDGTRNDIGAFGGPGGWWQPLQPVW
jgi:hypothetical protein